MAKSRTFRWTVIAAGAVLLLLLAAACSSETVEVPGETVVVEKIVTETVEVPGETVVVEKEVIKTVEVPGETVTKEVVKEVMVPGETVVVKEEVIKTVEVPGETVVKEVVKTVEVPGETVVVEKEVIKEVEVPGETVVVKQEVVKLIEVPAAPVEPAMMAADQIEDPRTGKMINPPQYGGSISYAIPFNPGFFDPQFGWAATRANSPIFEKLLIADWTVPFEVNPFDNRFYIGVPEHTANWLAESYEISSDLLTYTFKIRPGVHYHKNDNIEWNGENGRESNAYDWEYAWQRQLGLGAFEEGEVNPFTSQWVGVPIDSVTAVDNYTVEFKFSQPFPLALGSMIHAWHGCHVYPKEVIEQFGDFKEWTRAIGTGPFQVVSYEDAVAITYEKHPDYWANDPLFPEYELPYLDTLKAQIIPEPATRLAALRTAKLDWERRIGPEQATALLDSHPDLVHSTYVGARGLDMAINVQKPPMEDIRVRKAMNMAIDRETIATAYYKGWADPTIHGVLNAKLLQGWGTPFEEWPEQLQAEYTYNPEAANALLDEAGYERGPDGFRLKTAYELSPEWYSGDLGYAKIIKFYFAEIGIDLEIRPLSRAELVDRTRAGENDLSWTLRGSAHNSPPFAVDLHGASCGSISNAMHACDPVFDKLAEDAVQATTIEEMKERTTIAEMYAVEQHWVAVGFDRYQANFWWPWIGGYRGENELRGGPGFNVLTRVWVYQDVKSGLGY